MVPDDIEPIFDYGSPGDWDGGGIGDLAWVEWGGTEDENCVSIASWGSPQDNRCIRPPLGSRARPRGALGASVHFSANPYAAPLGRDVLADTPQ